MSSSHDARVEKIHAIFKNDKEKNKKPPKNKQQQQHPPTTT